jgi:hypothetical protein
LSPRELFDSSTDIAGSCYKAGDSVELKRKSKNAAYLKRGDVVQVEAVHPVNGSVKFWNEHTQRWGFLYPEEIKLTVKPVFGEIPEPIVESVFGEIPEPIVESVFGEIPEPIVESVFGKVSELTVESVFGELPEPIVESVFGKVSELKVESVFGEASAKNYGNCNKGYSGNEWLESHYKIRVDGKQRSINSPEIGCTGSYYSYRWIEGKQQRAKYTPTSKCPAVRKSLAMRQPISEILKIISSQ